MPEEPALHRHEQLPAGGRQGVYLPPLNSDRQPSHVPWTQKTDCLGYIDSRQALQAGLGEPQADH